jgi:hypothetical protein
MVYAYMRQVPDFPNLTTQQSDILSFSLKKELTIDKEVVEYATKNLLLDEREEFEDFLQTMQDGYTVIVSSLYILRYAYEQRYKHGRYLSITQCIKERGERENKPDRTSKRE